MLVHRAAVQVDRAVLGCRRYDRSAAFDRGLFRRRVSAYVSLVVETRNDMSRAAMRADLRTAPHAERDVSVLVLTAREARLNVPVVVDDRSVAARCLDLVRGAPLEQHVARRGAHAQAIERRVGRRYSSAEGLHET